MFPLYKNIKSRRLELGMTQSDLAKILGYSDKSMIAKIEKGAVDLPQSKIFSFAKALSIPPEELMGWDDQLLQRESGLIRAGQWKIENCEKEMLKTFSQLTDENKKKSILYTENLYNIQQLDTEQECILNAAHLRTDIDIPNDIDTSDDDIMDDEDF